MGSPANTVDSLIERSAPDPHSGCWQWLGHTSTDGYAQAKFNGRDVGVHRVVYAERVGPLMAGMEIDHLCRNRACINPAHLEQVTKAENMRRGFSLQAINGRKTHCDNGHPFDEDNTKYRPGGRGRDCATCCRARGLAYYHRRAAARRNAEAKSV